jgi:hypothetical protein
VARPHVSTTAVQSPRAPRLLDQVRHRLRALHYSYRTEQVYTDWIRRYILFHDKRHPRDVGRAEVERFLTYLAVQRNVAASTQNQAMRYSKPIGCPAQNQRDTGAISSPWPTAPATPWTSYPTPCRRRPSASPGRTTASWWHRWNRCPMRTRDCLRASWKRLRPCPLPHGVKGHPIFPSCGR